MTIPTKPVTCRYCMQQATGVVSAKGGTLAPSGPILHCDEHWEDAYRIVVRYAERTWKMIEQPPGLF